MSGAPQIAAFACAPSKRSRWGAAALLALTATVACTPAPTRSLLLVTIDTLRADHCSAYGYERRTTPTLDALAAQGALFENFYAPSAVTAPSHAALFTGESPTAAGVRRNGIALSEGKPVLAEVLRRAGYQTAAFVSSAIVATGSGFERGFEHFDDRFPEEGASIPAELWIKELAGEGFDRRAEATTDLAIEWLQDRRADRPFFLWVHYFDPHRPYEPPPPHDALFEAEADRARSRVVARYDGEIHYTDTQLARLVESAERDSPDLVVAVTADHGQGLMDHGWPTHGPLLYEEDLRIPLVVRAPGRVEPGVRIARPASLIDLAPMVLAWLGVDAGSTPMGRRSATPARSWFGAPGDAAKPLFFERREYTHSVTVSQIWDEPREVARLRVVGEKLAMRRGAWKLIEAPTEGVTELYDLMLDPKERTNLAGEEPERVAAMRLELARWHEGERARAPEGPPAEIDPADRERLRALGYTD